MNFVKINICPWPGLIDIQDAVREKIIMTKYLNLWYISVMKF